MTGTTVRSKLRLAKAAAKNSSEEIIANDGFSVSAAPRDARLNPLGDLIDDTTFAILQQHKLIDQKSLRDYQIRKSYREMREKMSAGDAIDKLQQMHPYLQFDTIRKIVYQMSPKAS
jgi:hypothetical protein